MATRITVDREFGSDSWWDNATAAPDRPAKLTPILTGKEREIEVSDTEAAEIERWCAAIPGWGEGTEYAAHPLLFNPA